MGLSISDVIPITFFIVLMIIGLSGLIYGLKEGLKVSVVYMNGILTASSILFGFWAILIERKPKKGVKRWQFEVEKWQYQIMSKLFYASFTSLLASVLFMYLSALDVVSSVLTLIACTISFYFNAYLVAITLYYYKFKET